MNELPTRTTSASATRFHLPEGYRLRDFADSDYDRAVELWRSCEGIGLNESDSRGAITSFLLRNPGLSVVALDAAGTIVGAVLCGHDGRRGYLHHLAVAPAHRRQGIGRRLVESCLSRLGAIGIAKCNIFLYRTNSAGQAFWIQSGWSSRDDLVLIQRPIRRD